MKSRPAEFHYMLDIPELKFVRRLQLPSRVVGQQQYSRVRDGLERGNFDANKANVRHLLFDSRTLTT